MNTEKDEKRNAHVLIFLVDIKKTCLWVLESSLESFVSTEWVSFLNRYLRDFRHSLWGHGQYYI